MKGSLALVFVCALAVGGCVEEVVIEAPTQTFCTGRDAEGGVAGVLLSNGIAHACGFLLIEPSFVCPEVVPHIHDYDSWVTLCTKGGQVDDWIPQRLTEMGCRPGCAAGWVCALGECLDPCVRCSERQVCVDQACCTPRCQGVACQERNGCGGRCVCESLCPGATLQMAELVSSGAESVPVAWREEPVEIVSGRTLYGGEGEELLWQAVLINNPLGDYVVATYDAARGVREEYLRGGVLSATAAFVSTAARGYLPTEKLVYVPTGELGGQTTWTYDEHLRLLSRAEDRPPVDGKIDVLETRSYDQWGNLIETTIYDDGDDVVDYRAIWTYAGLELPLTHHLDEDGDGVPDETTTWSYDAEGRLLEVGSDIDGDGLYEIVERWTYGPDGVPARIEEVWYAIEHTVGGRTTKLFDAHGRLVHQEEDTGDDGVIERWHTWTYDEAGNMLTRETGSDHPGRLGELELWSYDELGNMLTHRIDRFDDGGTYTLETWSWGPQGEPLAWRVDADGDGQIDVLELWVYDSGGHLLTRTRDDDLDDPAVDLQVTWSYICP